MKNLFIVTATIMLTLLSIMSLSPWPVWIGTLAAWATTGSFCLQVLHIVKNKDTSGLSLGMWAVLFFGVSCWGWYGHRMNDVPVMAANGITTILVLTVILLKLWHERPMRNTNRRKMVRMPRVILKPRISHLHPLSTPASRRRKKARPFTK